MCIYIERIATATVMQSVNYQMHERNQQTEPGKENLKKATEKVHTHTETQLKLIT